MLHTLFRGNGGFTIGRIICLRQEEVIPQQIRRDPFPICRRIVADEVPETGLMLLGILVLHESEDRAVRRHEIPRHLGDERDSHRMDRVHRFKVGRLRFHVRQEFANSLLDRFGKNLLAIRPLRLVTGANLECFADQTIGCLVTQ